MSAHSQSRDPSPSDPQPLTNHVTPDLSDAPTSPGLSTPPHEPNGACPLFLLSLDSPSPILCPGSDVKNSRKREREVSLEPATPHASTLDIDSERPDPKERRTPAKKNRTSDSVLEAPQEQAEDDDKLNGSPPHETKIRQISQGVEDITWQNINKDASPDLQLASNDTNPATEPETNMETVTDAQLQSVELDEVSLPVDTNPQSDDQREVVLPPLMRGENPPILDHTAGLEEDTGAAAGAEHPPDSHGAGAPDPSTESTSLDHSRRTIPDAPRLPSTHRRDSDSDQEKGLKRKLCDRTVSEALVPGDIPGGNDVAAVGPTKRPRDDPEADPNTREKKRPTPPPDENEKQEKTSSTPPADVAPKFGGFMAYASTTSPFSNVSGPRIFGANQPSTSPWTAATATSSGSPSASAFSSGATASFSSFASSSSSPFSSTSASGAKDASSSPASTSPAHKRTGFEAFASSTSPFGSAAKRPKSPPPPPSSVLRSRSPSRHGTPARSVNAFSAYAVGGAQGFTAPTPKRSPPLGEVTSSGEANVVGSSSGHAGNVLDAGKDSGSGEESESGKEEKKGASFKEQLRAGKDREEDDEDEEQKRLNLTEQQVHTGEEEEDTVYQVRGKLFALSEQNQWKERGTGMLRLNVRSEDGGGARLVMRKEAVYTVLLNATLFKGMRCFPAQDPRYIRFSVFEGNTTTHYNLRVSNAKIAEELLDEITAHIPAE
ncbi:hypothetical protein LXA43DRAFT_552771 [Ganoderma leucocontextum]|nr:hypothetical protein LXA43DRAFT_552771 [Ganoderma leucocontextum]